MCAALTALWIRSYWRLDTIGLRVDWQSSKQCVFCMCGLNSNYGGVAIGSTTDKVPVSHSDTATWTREQWYEYHPRGLEFGSEPALPNYLFAMMNAPSTLSRKLGFELVGAHRMDGPMRDISFDVHRLLVPHWLLVGLFAVLPASRGTRWFRKRFRAAKGLCPVCGYNLHATPDRCPECGTATRSGGLALSLRRDA
jgi:hypothetical protein